MHDDYRFAGVSGIFQSLQIIEYLGRDGKKRWGKSSDGSKKIGEKASKRVVEIS